MKAVVAFAVLLLVVEAAHALICIQSTCQRQVFRYGRYCGDLRSPTIFCYKTFYETSECNQVCDAGLSEWTTLPPDACSKPCGGGTRYIYKRRACNGNLRDIRQGEFCTYQSFHNLEEIAGIEPCNTHSCPTRSPGCVRLGPFCRG